MHVGQCLLFEHGEVRIVSFDVSDGSSWTGEVYLASPECNDWRRDSKGCSEGPDARRRVSAINVWNAYVIHFFRELSSADDSDSVTPSIIRMLLMIGSQLADKLRQATSLNRWSREEWRNCSCNLRELFLRKVRSCSRMILNCCPEITTCLFNNRYLYQSVMGTHRLRIYTWYNVCGISSS